MDKVKENVMSEPITFQECNANQKLCQEKIMNKIDHLDDKIDTVQITIARIEQRISNNNESQKGNMWKITTIIALGGLLISLIVAIKSMV